MSGEEAAGAADDVSVRKIPAEDGAAASDGPSRRAWAILAGLTALAAVGALRLAELALAAL